MFSDCMQYAGSALHTKKRKKKTYNFPYLDDRTSSSGPLADGMQILQSTLPCLLNSLVSKHFSFESTVLGSRRADNRQTSCNESSRTVGLW